jgi:hypothetical protein
MTPRQEASLQSTDDLRLVELAVDKFIPETAAECCFVIVSAEGRKIGFRFTPAEGAMFSFVHYGFAAATHVRTIHHLYLETMETLGYRLESSTVEAKHGDMYYARLHFTGKDSSKPPLFVQSSLADAIILALMAGSKLQAVKRVVDDMDDMEWPHRIETISFDR